jgi:hypothetical protein
LIGESSISIPTELRPPLLGDADAGDVRQLRHSFGMREGIEECQRGSPRVPDERPPLVAPRDSQRVDIGDERLDVDRLDLPAPAAAALLVAVDGAHVAKHVRHRSEVVADPRPAVHQKDRVPAATRRCP